jgi:hypothetical protein
MDVGPDLTRFAVEDAKLNASLPSTPDSLTPMPQLRREYDYSVA